MVDRVRAIRLRRIRMKVALEVAYGALRGRFIRKEAKERWIERRHVLGEKLRRIALRIDGDEKSLDLIRVGAERLHCARQQRERRRAHVRATGVTEEDEHNLAAEVGERALLPVAVSELEAMSPCDAGDVDGFEALRRLGTERCIRRHRADD